MLTISQSFLCASAGLPLLQLRRPSQPQHPSLPQIICNNRLFIVIHRRSNYRLRTSALRLLRVAEDLGGEGGAVAVVDVDVDAVGFYLMLQHDELH